MEKSNAKTKHFLTGFFTRNSPAKWRIGSSPETYTLMSALRIAAIYLVIGALWILLSDLVVDIFIKDPALKTLVSIVKGWVYVVITAIILAMLVRGALSKILEYDRRFTTSNETLSHANRELLRYQSGLDSLVHERTVKLQSATEEAKNASLAKSNFIAHMSHEIRTPLNAIVGLTHLMGKTALDAKQAEYCSMMQNSSNILLGIINDVLDFAKIESGKLELCESPYSLKSLMSRIESILFPLVKGKGLSLEITIDPAIPDHLIGDELRLGQILLNLSMNAVKFTKHGFVKISITPLDNSNLRFTVTDSGIGIPDTRIDRLFKPFSQADSSTTKEYGGTGLGLVICKLLVEAMGGTIGVSSKEGVGTDFFFELSQKEAPTESVITDIHNTDDTDNTRGSSHTRKAAPGYKKLKPQLRQGASVLIVDDNEINLMILEECFRDSQIALRSASGGREALALAETVRFDVILLDLHMPELDGLSVARAIRANTAISQPVIIALTADADSAVRDCVLGAGMNDFITKPIDHDNLLVCVGYWLNHVTETSSQESR